MKLNASQNCIKTNSCRNDYEPITVQVTKSAKVDKTNTLHQFDTANIVGLESPVGKIPIMFYVKESCSTGRRGIIYFGGRDTVCFMYPETEMSEWCRQPYHMKYDALVPFDNGVERGARRNHGIFELWISVFRKWYNGQVMYRPRMMVQGCGRREGGYPRVRSQLETLEPKRVSRPVQVQKKTKTTRGCGCRKGA